MFTVLFTCAIIWLAKFRSSMTEGERLNWEKVRKRGIVAYLFKWTALFFVILFAVDFCWSRFFDHKSMDTMTVTLSAAEWFLISFVISVADWYVDNDRYRKFGKDDSTTAAQLK
jgi:hypothetical protein